MRHKVKLVDSDGSSPGEKIRKMSSAVLQSGLHSSQRAPGPGAMEILLERCPGHWGLRRLTVVCAHSSVKGGLVSWQ